MASLAIDQQRREAGTSLIRGYSFEISARDADRLDGIRRQVPDGTIVSITSLPNEDDAARIAAAARVRALGLVPMPHIAARRVASADDLARTLGGFAAAGVDRLFIIAGDVATVAGPYADALALIRAVPIARHGIGTVAIAGYPDGHPAIAATALDQARRDKLAALAGQGIDAELMTQFGFDAGSIVAWLRALRAERYTGIVRLGLPGPASVGTLLRYASRCGVGVSARAMAKYGASITRLLSQAGPDRLYRDLARTADDGELGPIALHLFPFGGLERMAVWAGAATGDMK